MQIRAHMYVWRIHRVLLKSTGTHMCMQVCIYTCICVRVYTYICVIHTCMHVYVASTVSFNNAWCAWQLSVASQKIYTYAYLCVSHTCMHIYVCIHPCAYICVTVDLNTFHLADLSCLVEKLHAFICIIHIHMYVMHVYMYSCVS